MNLDTLNLPHVTLTTDGAAISNPGPGGWSVLLEYGEVERLLSGAGTETSTNNQMELQAVIEGLRALKKPCSVTLRADSRYVLQGIENILQGKSLNSEMKNASLWTELAKLVQRHTITLEWVQGHAGDARNERVDQAATAAAQALLDSSPRYREQQEAIDAIIESLQLNDDWVLVVSPAAAGHRSHWRLYNPQTITEGECRHANTAVSVWTALLDGLDSATDAMNDDDESINLHVLTSVDFLVRQASGEWRVKHPELIPLAEQVQELSACFDTITFWLAPTSKIEPLVAAADSSDQSRANSLQHQPPLSGIGSPQHTAVVRADMLPTDADWVLAIRSGRPVRWRLLSKKHQDSGQVSVGAVTEPIAAWQALIAGLRVAAAYAHAEQTLHVQTNYELVVHQANGEWKVKHEAIRSLADELRLLCRHFQAVTFTWVGREVFQYIP